MKYINADLIKELMKRSIALQGNCEYTLWLQTVDNYVENLPSIDIDSRGHETMSDKVWCSKCRYLYRDFKYGLSCYRLMDDEPCKFEYRKTDNSSEKPNNCETCKHNKLEWYSEICDSCCGNNNHYEPKDEPTGYNLSPVDKDTNVRSKTEPTTQTETQNSNLTFEKRTMRDCYNCKRYEAEGECIECHYEPKDEPQTDCPWK